MHKGFVKLYRKSIKNPLYCKPLVWHFWGYCLKKANHKDNTIDFNGKPLLLKKGSFIMSLGKTSKVTGLSIQNIRTAIKNLVNHKMIENLTQQVTGQSTIINVINYAVYQDFTNQSNTASNTGLTQSQQSTNTGLTTDKNVKNNKELLKNDKKKESTPKPKQILVTEDKQKFIDNLPESITSKYPMDFILSTIDTFEHYCLNTTNGRKYTHHYKAIGIFLKKDSPGGKQANKTNYQGKQESRSLREMADEQQRNYKPPMKQVN